MVKHIYFNNVCNNMQSFILKGLHQYKRRSSKCPILLLEPPNSSHQNSLHSRLHFGSSLVLFGGSDLFPVVSTEFENSLPTMTMTR